MRGYVSVMECETADYEPWHDAIWHEWWVMCSWRSHKAQWWAFMGPETKSDTMRVSQWASVDKTSLPISYDAFRVTIFWSETKNWRIFIFLFILMVCGRMWRAPPTAPLKIKPCSPTVLQTCQLFFAPRCPITAGLRTQTIGSACCCWFFLLQFAWTHESSSSGLLLLRRSRGKHTRDSLQNVKAVSVSVKAMVTGSSVGHLFLVCRADWSLQVWFSGASSFLLLLTQQFLPCGHEEEALNEPINPSNKSQLELAHASHRPQKLHMIQLSTGSILRGACKLCWCEPCQQM